MGRIMNSCIASALPAWLPPLMMLKLGTGSTCVLQGSDWRLQDKLPDGSLQAADAQCEVQLQRRLQTEHAHQLAVACELCYVLVERDLLLCCASLREQSSSAPLTSSSSMQGRGQSATHLADAHGHRQDRVCAQLALVLRAVEVEHLLVHLSLLRGVHALHNPGG